jgi:muramoyltetrapeptide carboxypeptidase
LAELEALGYSVVLAPHALDSGPLYYAGCMQDRVKDLHAAFADSAIDGIICTRGGWGSAELLPHLDAGLIRANPKAFIGYSDHTSLHSWLQREVGLASFCGPMVASDFGRDNGVDLASWRHTFDGDSGWSLGAADGLRVLQAGEAVGELRGGCISILAAGLGTPYAPALRDCVLFLEDVGTKPYQWDRLLLHLRYAGRLEGVRGIVFGDMTQCVEPEEQELLERAILHGLRGFKGPVAIGLRCGHVTAPNVTLPLGVQVRLDFREAADPQIHFPEAAVRA